MPGVRQAEFIGESHGAVDLNSPVNGLKSSLHGVSLGHAELFDSRFALVEQGCSVDSHEVRSVQLGGAFGQREADCLVVRDGLAEGLACLCVVKRLL